jgi:hypothetical protein
MRSNNCGGFRGNSWKRVGLHAKTGTVVWCIFPSNASTADGKASVANGVSV